MRDVAKDIDILAGRIEWLKMEETVRSLLERVAGAVVLFHSQGEWNEHKQHLWRELTGSESATTRALCDFARAALVVTIKTESDADKLGPRRM